MEENKVKVEQMGEDGGGKDARRNWPKMKGENRRTGRARNR